MVGYGYADCGCTAANTGKRISAAIVTRQRAADDDDDSRADANLDEATVDRGLAEALFLRENREYVDWWLLQAFPGRTLEELDDIDWLRFMRAQDVGRLVSNEQRRKLWLDGALKDSDLTAAEWRHMKRFAYLDEGENG